MALNRIWLPSPNFYQGNNGRRLLVIHSSEGAQDIRSLGAWFANSANQVSSHVGIDNAQRGTIGEYVRRGDTAWTAMNANPVAVQAECCTPSGASANWSEADWKSRPTMLANLADWLAEESAATGIPLVALTPGQAQGTGRGVCQHSDLGAWGGSHHDCGPGFPMGYVLGLATGSGPATTEEDDMGPYQLVLDSAYRAELVFTNEQRDAQMRLLLGCRTPCTVRLLWADSSTTDLPIVNNQRTSARIPAGCGSVVVQVTDPATGPASPISYAVGV